METIHEGRTYEITDRGYTTDAMRRDLIRRGWDGVYYTGISEPCGRQRIRMCATFYRSAATGEFIFVVRV